MHNNFFKGDILRYTGSSRNSFNPAVINENRLGFQEIVTIFWSGFKFENKFELYKKDAILIKVGDGIYVDKDNINSIFDYINIIISIKNNERSNVELISNFPICYGNLFVKEKLLEPYNASKKSLIYTPKSKK